MLPTSHTDEASAEVSALLRDVQATYGTVPTLLRVMASSPVLLRGYLELATALQDGRLPVELRERIAITVAAGNACEHCLTGHEYLARHVAKIPREEVEAARSATSVDPRTRAILRFANAVNIRRGAVSADTF